MTREIHSEIKNSSDLCYSGDIMCQKSKSLELENVHVY